MIRTAAIMIMFGSAQLCLAQYDVGVGGGGFYYAMNFAKPESPRTSLGTFERRPSFSPVFNAYYRRTPVKGVGGGVDVQWSTKKVYYAYRQGSGSSYHAHFHQEVRMNDIHISIFPEFNLGRSKKFKFKFGQQFGIRTGTLVADTVEIFDIGYYSSFAHENWDRQWRLGEMRVMIGLVYRSSISDRVGFYMEPYFAHSVTRVKVSAPKGANLYEAGLKVSCAWRVPGHARVQKPKKKKEPGWMPLPMPE